MLEVRKLGFCEEGSVERVGRPPGLVAVEFVESDFLSTAGLALCFSAMSWMAGTLLAPPLNVVELLLLYVSGFGEVFKVVARGTASGIPAATVWVPEAIIARWWLDVNTLSFLIGAGTEEILALNGVSCPSKLTGETRELDMAGQSSTMVLPPRMVAAELLETAESVLWRV